MIIMKIKDKLKYINNFPIIIMVIVAVLGVLLFNIYLKFNPYTTVNISGYMAASNNMTYNLINNANITSDMNIEAVAIHPGDYVYKQYDTFFVGEESKQEIEYDYPLYSNDGLTVYNSNRDTVLIDENFDKTSGYKGLSLNDGVLYNDGDLQPADELNYYFLSLNNSIFINTQVITIKTLYNEYTIPMNSPCYFGLSYVNYYVLDGKEFKYNRISDIYYDSIVTIKDKSMSYEKFLLSMNLVEEKKETIPEIIEEIEEELNIIKEEMVEPDVIVPEVSIDNFKTSVYSATSTLSLVDKEGVMTQYPTFEFYDSHDNLVFRKRVHDIGSFTVSGLSANTTYKVKGSFKYKNKKDRVFTVDFYEGTIKTLPLDALEPVIISAEIGEITSSGFTLKNVYIENTEAEAVSGIKRLLLNVFDNDKTDYVVEMDLSQIKKLMRGETSTFKGPDGLKSNTDYEYKFLAYDKDNNVIEINSIGSLNIKTYKQKPTVKISGKISNKNELDYVISVNNPDNVIINNFSYNLISSSNNVVDSGVLEYLNDYSLSATQLLNEKDTYTVTVTGNYNLEDGQGLQEFSTYQLFTTDLLSTVKVLFPDRKYKFGKPGETGEYISNASSNSQITFLFAITDIERIRQYNPVVKAEYQKLDDKNAVVETIAIFEKNLEDLISSTDGKCFVQSGSNLTNDLICYDKIEELNSNTSYNVIVYLQDENSGTNQKIVQRRATEPFKTKKADAVIQVNEATLIANSLNVKLTIKDSDEIIGDYKYSGSDDKGESRRRLVYLKLCESQGSSYCPYKKFIELEAKKDTVVEINSNIFSAIADQEFDGRDEYIDKNYLYNLDEYTIVVTSKNYNGKEAVEENIKFQLDELSNNLQIRQLETPILDLTEYDSSSSKTSFSFKCDGNFEAKLLSLVKFKDCVNGVCVSIDVNSRDFKKIKSGYYEGSIQVSPQQETHTLSAILVTGDSEIVLSSLTYNATQGVAMIDNHEWNEFFETGIISSDNNYVVTEDIVMNDCPKNSVDRLDTTIDFQGHSLTISRTKNCDYLFKEITSNGTIKNMVMNYNLNINGFIEDVHSLSEVNNGEINNVIVYLNQNIYNSQGSRYNEYGFSNLNLLTKTNTGNISQFIVYLVSDIYFAGNSSLLVHENSGNGSIRNGYIAFDPSYLEREAHKPTIYLSQGGYYGNFAYYNYISATIERVYNIVDILQNYNDDSYFEGIGSIVFKNHSVVRNTLSAAAFDYPNPSGREKKYGPSIYSTQGSSHDVEVHEQNYYINLKASTLYSYRDDYSFNLKSLTNIYTVNLLKTVMGETDDQESFWYRKSYYPYLNMNDVMEDKQKWIQFMIQNSSSQIIPIDGTITSGTKCSDVPTISISFYMSKDYQITSLVFDDFTISNIAPSEQSYNEHTGQKTVIVSRDVEWKSTLGRKEGGKHKEYTLRLINYNMDLGNGDYFPLDSEVDHKITGTLYKKVNNYDDFVLEIDLNRDICLTGDLEYNDKNNGNDNIPNINYYYNADIDGNGKSIDFKNKEINNYFIGNGQINLKNIRFKNLTIKANNSKQQLIGFFGALEYSNIENVDFENVQIVKEFKQNDIRNSYNYYIGVLAGKATYCHVNKVSVNSDQDVVRIITSNSDAGDNPEQDATVEYNDLNVGGIIGSKDYSIIGNTYVYSVNSEDKYQNIVYADKYLKGQKNYIGGIVGKEYSGNVMYKNEFDISQSNNTPWAGIIDSYVIGNIDTQFEVNNNVSVGGILGYSVRSNLYNNYMDGKLYTGRGQHVGGILGYSNAAFSETSVSMNNLFLGDIYSLSPENTVAAIGSIVRNDSQGNYTWRLYSYPETNGITVNENVISLRNSWISSLGTIHYGVTDEMQEKGYPYLLKHSLATQQTQNMKLSPEKLIILQDKLDYVEYDKENNSSILKNDKPESANAVLVTLKAKNIRMENVSVSDPNYVEGRPKSRIANFRVKSAEYINNADESPYTRIEIYIYDVTRYNGAYKMLLQGTFNSKEDETFVYLNGINLYRQLTQESDWTSIELNDNVYLRNDIQINISGNNNNSKRIHYLYGEPGSTITINGSSDKSLIEEITGLEDVNFLGNGSDQALGSIINYNYGNIKNSSFKNINIQGSEYVGIISENQSGSALQNIAIGNISIKGKAALGGLIGSDYTSSNIDVKIDGAINIESNECEAVDEEKKYSYIGGLIGYKSGGNVIVDMLPDSKIDIKADGSCKNYDDNGNFLNYGVGGVGGILGVSSSGVVKTNQISQNSIKNISISITGNNDARYLGGIVGKGIIGEFENNSVVKIENVRIRAVNQNGEDTNLGQHDTNYIGGVIGEGRLLGDIRVSLPQNYTIATKSTDYVGGIIGKLIPYETDVLNLSVNNANSLIDIKVSGDEAVGGIAGSINPYYKNNGTRYNPNISIILYAGGIISSGYSKVGGVIGDGHATNFQIYLNKVKNCSETLGLGNEMVNAAVCVNGRYNVGGIYGHKADATNSSNFEGLIFEVNNTALKAGDYKVAVKGIDSAGGIVGISRSGITNSDTNNLKVFDRLYVIGTGKYVGGLVGYNYYGIRNFAIKNSYIKLDGYYAGGLAGFIGYSGKVSGNVVRDSTITARNYVGGLLGGNAVSYVNNNQVYNNNITAYEASGSSQPVGIIIGEWSTNSSASKNANILENQAVNNTISCNCDYGYLAGKVRAVPNSISIPSQDHPDDPNEDEIIEIYVRDNSVYNNNNLISNQSASFIGNLYRLDVSDVIYRNKYLQKVDKLNYVYENCNITDNNNSIVLSSCTASANSGEQSTTTKSPQLRKTRNYVVYASDVNKINVEFEENDSGSFQYKVGDYESDIIAIDNRTYTITYDFIDDIEIVVSDGDYINNKTYSAKDLVKTISAFDNDIYHLGDNDLYKNDEIIGNGFVNLYGTQVLSNDGIIYNIDTMESVESDYNKYILVDTKPLYEFEYDNHKIATYYNYSLVDGAVKDYQLIVKNGVLNVIDKDLSNKKDAYIIDSYNNKEYQIVLINNKLQSLKDSIKYPETLKNENIKDVYSDIYSSSAIAVLLYDDGVYAFNYLTGNEVYTNIKTETETLAGFISRKLGFSSAHNNTIDRVASSKVYNETLDLKEKIEETSVEEANGIVEHNNVAVEVDKNYVTSYNSDTKKYDIYDVEELLNDEPEIESENEKIEKNYELVKFYSKKPNGEKDSSLSGVIIFTFTIVAIIWSLFILVRKRKAREVA